jgi:SAM-dependent methyltransferase
MILASPGPGCCTPISLVRAFFAETAFWPNLGFASVSSPNVRDRAEVFCDTAAIEGAYHQHYASYDAEQIHRLDGFYGRVDESFNERISDHVAGREVLDFGCGFGSLVEHLRRRGYEATGIDLLDFQVSAGRERFPDADLRVVTPGLLPFADLAFDTVVFKESLHHLAAESDIATQLAEVARVCSRRMIIFEPNPSMPLKIGRTLIGHVDPTLPVSSARTLLEQTGFHVTAVQYLSSFAFPLSGGYVGKPILSGRTPARVLRIDDRIVRALGRHIAWRYLMVADGKR